jgi:hypothetical protein
LGCGELKFSSLDDPGSLFVGWDPDDAGIFPVGIAPVPDPDPDPVTPEAPEPEVDDFNFEVEDIERKII